MFFDDDANDDRPRSDGEPLDDAGSGRAERLVRAADGESVTADRLRGEEKYFPNCLPHLYRDQQPHHLLLLTTSNEAFGVVTKTLAPTALSADEGGVALFTEETVLVVVDDDGLFEIPYSKLDSTKFGTGHVILTANGRGYYLDVAMSADEDEVAAAYDYLRRQVYERHA